MISSCTSTSSISKLNHDNESMEIYMAKIPDKDFQELSFIEVRGGVPMSPNSLMKSLIQKAQDDGANGLINVRMETKGNMIHISGVAVKFQ